MYLYLLQISRDDSGGNLLITFIFFLIGVFITRWIFRIDTMVKNLQATVRILIRMAQKSGVPDEEIQKIIDEFKVR